MQFSDAMRDAARCLEEAAAVFRFKSRNTLDEYAELGGRWSDARARQFTLRHLDSQRERMEHGESLCRVHGDLIASAQASADSAERELAGFSAAQDEFETSASESLWCAQAARNLAASSSSVSSMAASALQALNGAIGSAGQDPGW